jgi:hypothetical protein
MASFKDAIKDAASNFVDSWISDLLSFGGAEAQSGFNVERLKTSLNTSGFAKTSDFEVWVYGPDGNVQRDMTLRVDTVDLPGRNFGLADHKFNNIGPVNRIPTMQTYSDVTITMILSEDLREKDYFESWQNLMMDTGVYEGSNSAQEINDFSVFSVNGAGINSNYTGARFQHKYFDNYIGRVEIRQYGSGGNLTSIHTLQEAYPTSIAPVGMNWGDAEGVAKLAVTFSYKNYRAVFNKANQPGMGAGFYFNLGKDSKQFGIKLPELGNISYTKGAGFSVDFTPVKKRLFAPGTITQQTSTILGLDATTNYNGGDSNAAAVAAAIGGNLGGTGTTPPPNN